MCVCVWVCKHFNVFVLVYVYVCVNGYLFACAYRRVTVTQSSAARPPGGSASRSSVLSRRHVSGGHGCAGSTEPVACAASQTGIFDTGTHNAVSALLHAAAGACFVFVVCCCVGVPVVDVGMYVCGAACYACCGVLQRRHNFDVFLKRIIGKRQP